MRKILAPGEVHKTLRECKQSVEQLRSVLGIVAPRDMDRYEELKDLQLRCADSLHTLERWMRKGMPSQAGGELKREAADLAPDAPAAPGWPAP